MTGDFTFGPLEVVGCNLCGSDPQSASVVALSDRYGLPTRIVQCPCGLRYISPRWTAERYAKFYRDEYRPLLATVIKRPYQLAEIEADQWAYAVSLSNYVAPLIERHAGGRVVDVGGSTGIVGRVFRARWGMQVTVIDPAQDELNRARDCETVCASAEQAEFPVSNVALLCRTIDHLLDPKGVLTRLRAAATTLVVDAMDVDEWPENSRYKVDHPYAFTAETLRKMVQAAGWHLKQGWKLANGRYVGYVCE